MYNEKIGSKTQCKEHMLIVILTTTIKNTNKKTITAATKTRNENTFKDCCTDIKFVKFHIHKNRNIQLTIT